MAEVMISYLMTSFRQQLKEILGKREFMIGESKAQVGRLENELRLLKEFLRDVGRNQAERSTELDLERQVKELVYDLEDIRESWLIHLQATITVTSYPSLLFQRVGRILQRQTRSIINDRVEPISRIIGAYTQPQVQQQPMIANLVPLVQLNRVVPPIRIKKIVGFENTAQSLIDRLMQETEYVDVISITGMPGIGKTTLAWKIYQDDTIRTEFPTRIWVDIRHNSCSKLDLYFHILKEFIRQGMPDHEELLKRLDMPRVSCGKQSLLVILDAFYESGRINEHQLISGVQFFLGMRRSLLVMDAVWNAESLKSVKDLVVANTGKILITTSNKKVCSDANMTRKSHELGILNENDSWDLFQWEVFGNLHECPDMLRSAAENIARGCGGSPLAITVAACSLMVPSSKMDTAAVYQQELWWRVSQNVVAHVARYDRERVFRSAELSYGMLTQRLQDCFLYLGVFPQGHEIHARTLIRLWIAERLVKEERTEQTLQDLIDRNMVKVDKTYMDGQIKTCHLDKLIHTFCMYKSAERGFYHEIKMPDRGALDPLRTPLPNHRRLCIFSHFSEIFSSASDGGVVRSIICYDKEKEVILHPKDGSNIHKCFDFLRVLEFNGVKFSKFPEMLSRIMFLRYISISCCDSTGAIIIPESMASLCYLETLVVETKLPTLEIRANIWKMLQLQNLVTKAAIVLAIKGKGKGKAGENLQTLTRLAPASCTKEVFARAPNLKRLGIRGRLSALSDPNSSFKELKFLEKLKLINEPAESFQLPRDFFLPNLKRLTLSGTKLGWDNMPILGKINDLEILKLENNAFIGESWISSEDDGFGCLEFLLIKDADLVTWEASGNCFPRLKRLVLKKCDKLQMNPNTLSEHLQQCIEIVLSTI